MAVIAEVRVQKAEGIKRGDPAFLLFQWPEMRIHEHGVEFLNTLAFKAPLYQRSVAYSLSHWLNYCQSRGLDYKFACREDLTKYKAAMYRYRSEQTSAYLKPGTIAQRIRAVCGFYDAGITGQRISGRFATAGEMADRLIIVLEAFHKSPTVASLPDLESLRARARSSARAEFERLKLVYAKAEAAIWSVHARVLSCVSPAYEISNQSWLDFSEGRRFELGFHYFANPARRFAPQFLITVVGDEIVVRMGDDAIFRTDFADPNFQDDEFRRELERRFIVGVSALMDSEPQPPA